VYNEKAEQLQTNGAFFRPVQVKWIITKNKKQKVRCNPPNKVCFYFAATRRFDLLVSLRSSRRGSKLLSARNNIQPKPSMLKVTNLKTVQSRQT